MKTRKLFYLLSSCSRCLIKPSQWGSTEPTEPTEPAEPAEPTDSTDSMFSRKVTPIGVAKPRKRGVFNFRRKPALWRALLATLWDYSCIKRKNFSAKRVPTQKHQNQLSLISKAERLDTNILSLIVLTKTLSPLTFIKPWQHFIDSTICH